MNANMQGTSMQGADLRGADLEYADMTGGAAGVFRQWSRTPDKEQPAAKPKQQDKDGADLER